jgi:hypothetical protein
MRPSPQLYAEYDCRVPLSWRISMVILVVCLIASLIIGTVKLLQT